MKSISEKVVVGFLLKTFLLQDLWLVLKDVLKMHAHVIATVFLPESSHYPGTGLYNRAARMKTQIWKPEKASGRQAFSGGCEVFLLLGLGSFKQLEVCDVGHKE